MASSAESLKGRPISIRARGRSKGACAARGLVAAIAAVPKRTCGNIQSLRRGALRSPVFRQNTRFNSSRLRASVSAARCARRRLAVRPVELLCGARSAAYLRMSERRREASRSDWRAATQPSMLRGGPRVTIIRFEDGDDGLALSGERRAERRGVDCQAVSRARRSGRTVRFRDVGMVVCFLKNVDAMPLQLFGVC